MDDDQQNEPGLILASVLGIAVTLAILVAVLSGVLSALNANAPTATGVPAVAAPVSAGSAAATPPAAAAGARLYFDTGKSEVNAELARRGAFTVRDALAGAGVASDKIELAKPRQTTGSTDEREARRVEVSAQ